MCCIQTNLRRYCTCHRSVEMQRDLRSSGIGRWNEYDKGLHLEWFIEWTGEWEVWIIGRIHSHSTSGMTQRWRFIFRCGPGTTVDTSAIPYPYRPSMHHSAWGGVRLGAHSTVYFLFISHMSAASPQQTNEFFSTSHISLQCGFLSVIPVFLQSGECHRKLWPIPGRAFFLSKALLSIPKPTHYLAHSWWFNLIILSMM